MADRHELARKIARRVSERVRRVAPPGIGRWDPAWEIVAAPSDHFMDALTAWEREATAETEERVRRTADELVEAWREAGRRFEATQTRGPEVPA